jgi:hypothetical protein
MCWWNDRVVPRVVDKALKGKETGGALRDRACAGLHGRVLEIGFGGGLNIRRTRPRSAPSTPSSRPRSAGSCCSRRARTPLPIERVGLDGERHEADDATYDGALVTSTLCTIPDAVAALREVRRVLRPGARDGSA